LRLHVLYTWISADCDYNQSGVAAGLLSRISAGDGGRGVRQLLAEVGVQLAGFYYCPTTDGVVPNYAILLLGRTRF